MISTKGAMQMEEARNVMRSKIRYVIGVAEQQLEEDYSSFEFYKSCGLTLFRGVKLHNGSESVDIFRFDKDGNDFNPSALGEEAIKSWIKALNRDRCSESRICLFLDISYRQVEMALAV
jgi:hypothetical protein